ncbi:MAG TPA: glycoside hydrolase family 6 protein [Polyangiaceae bacterium]|nr:glycoside hydrolase family 6 protein [Polyangiaceae bacterium]
MMKSSYVFGAMVCAAVAASGCGGTDTESASGEPSASATAELGSGCKLDKETRFYVPPPDPAAIKQVAALVKARDLKNAARITAMITTPQAVWLTGGTPKEVEKSVKKTMAAAALEKRVPVLVAYNVPFRDCAQYSSGGAVDTAAYKAWIDGFVKGIGSSKAVVILEPDSLGIIPYNVTIYGAEEWCKPTVTAADGGVTPAPGATPAERYAQLQYAAAALGAKAPNTSVYLDGSHAAWLGVGEAAYRIHKAGTDPVSGASLAKGFYVNASNYQTTANSIQFSTWISMCTAFATNPEEGGWRLGNFGWCASQYNPATDYGLDYSPEYAATVTAQIQGLMGNAVASLPFVIDTSRNGKGTLKAAQYSAAPYNQPDSVISGLNAGNWCNPPGAGLGLRPDATTGVPLLDAYLWVKTPGQSDGSCDIAGGARAWDYSQYNPWGLSSTDAQTHFDPLWGQVDPAAGAWFPEQALDLVKNANPALF